MFILDFFRFLRGTVQFSAQGVFVERFLNLVARDKIPVWDGRKRGDRYTACTSASSYRLLRKHAKKAGVRLRVEQKRGAPFQRRKYRRRKGVLLGLALFACFLFCMSLFVWRIEVNGNETVAESDILDALDRIGVRPGTLRGAINVREAEGKALLLLHDLSWLALNIDGSVIYVEVSEMVPPPDMVDPGSPCNLVAGKSGQIVSLVVYEGQPLVMEGDAVVEGDILVSGITQDRTGKSLYRHARADVTARVEEEIQIEIPLAQTELVETGDTAGRTYLQLLGMDLPLFLPLGIEGPYHVERESTPFRLFSMELPVGSLRETYILMEEVPVTYTEDQAKALALEELALVQKARLGDAEILEQTAKGGIQGGNFVIQAHYVCHMMVQSEKEILLSE